MQIASILSISQSSHLSTHTSCFQPYPGYTLVHLGHPPALPSHVYPLSSGKHRAKLVRGGESNLRARGHSSKMVVRSGNNMDDLDSTDQFRKGEANTGLHF